MAYLPQAPFLLIGVFVAFYLLDCIVLLRPGQGLLHFHLQRRRKRTKPRDGNPSSVEPTGRASSELVLDPGLVTYPMRGRYIALLNPLTPFLPVFKTAPVGRSSGVSATAARPLLRLRAAHLILRALMPLVLSHGLILYLLLPLNLLFGSFNGLLITLGLALISAGVIIVFSNTLRRILNIPLPAFWSLAAQSILCLPTSLNFPRKLCLQIETTAPGHEYLPRLAPARRGLVARDLRVTLDYGCGEAASEADIACLQAIVDRLKAEYPDA